MDWQKDMVERVVAECGLYPEVMLRFLLTRLEQNPDALTTIADALTDFSSWASSQAAGLRAVVQLRQMAANDDQGDTET